MTTEAEAEEEVVGIMEAKVEAIGFMRQDQIVPSSH